MKDIKTLLDNHPTLQKDLFIRGFLISDKSFNTQEFPFYGNWRVEQHGKYFFMAHELTGMNVYVAQTLGFGRFGICVICGMY